MSVGSPDPKHLWIPTAKEREEKIRSASEQEGRSDVASDADGVELKGRWRSKFGQVHHIRS